MRYKNIGCLIFADGYTAFVNAIAGLMAVRFLPLADFGAFTAAFAFAQIMTVLADSGMGALVGKRIAKQPSVAGSEMSLMLTWRLVATIVFTCLCPLAAMIFLPTSEMRHMATVLTPALILITTTDFASWIFKGLQRAQWCVVLQVSSRTFLLALCVVALLSQHPLLYLLTAYGMAGVLAALLALYVLSRITGPIRLAKLPRQFFSETIPNLYKLGGIIAINMIATRIDLILVARMCGSFQNGLYGSAARVMDGLRLMPTVALGVCLPIFSAVHDQRDQLRAKFMKAYIVVIALSMAMALLGSAYANFIFIRILGPSHGASVELFRPLVWSCILMYANILMFALLYAVNDHRTPAIAAVSAIGLNVLMNMLLLPTHGPVAASWSRIAAEACIFSVQSWSLCNMRIISFHDIFLKPAAIMGGCVVILGILSKTPLSYEWSVLVGIIFLIGITVFPCLTVIADTMEKV